MSASACVSDPMEIAPIEATPRFLTGLVETSLALKPLPPAWMVAPPLFDQPVMRVQEHRRYDAEPAWAGPFRSIREVPRKG